MMTKKSQKMWEAEMERRRKKEFLLRLADSMKGIQIACTPYGPIDAGG